MKKILKLVILSCVLFYGCEVPKSTNTVTKDGYVVKVIDDCEYIEVASMIGTNMGYYSLTHKGNCKYCFERNKTK